jgi:phosphoribosylformimino-5-aminoimidazole carboxamide ribotide isomerase
VYLIDALDFGASMNVIPVLDLKRGLVVLAAGGRRDAYRPVDTPLCADPEPAAVIAALTTLYPFKTFYIADLDRITSQGTNDAAVIELARRLPSAEFWLDGGFAACSDALPFAGIPNVRFVIGSESLQSLAHYAELRAAPQFTRHILSLDRKNAEELGPPDLITRPELWPGTVISMDLNRVGENRGPNRTRLNTLRACRADIEIAAAGGVRGIADLQKLSRDGITHALIATALHQKTLGPEDLAQLAANKKNAP